MDSKKMIPFYILNVLEEKTCQENGLLLSEIIMHINNTYKQKTGLDEIVSKNKTQTIKRNIDDINEFYYDSCGGIDLIQTCDDPRNRKYKRYFLGVRKFEPGEIAFLYDYIINNNSLRENEIEYLSEKLLSFLSRHERAQFIGQRLRDGSTRARNQGLYFNRERINEAISNMRNIEFDYYEYDMQKELVKRVRDYSYIVSPIRAISSGGKHYLIGYHIPTESFRTYRIDKIANLKINEEYDYHMPDEIDTEAYAKNSPHMHTDGDKILVKLRCSLSILDEVIERFAECRLAREEKDPGHFTATIPRTTYLGMKYWILGFTSYCEVLEPRELREDVKETLKRALGWYEK